MEIAAFLIGSASFMTSDELIALTRAMAEAGTQLKWTDPIVVDKHCIGGIPGNRTSMIVVPIVAAHGLPIPKTSSRAITSPAGTADTMEVLARVNVGVDEMKAIVAACNGCLVWGGHVNLSPADDILISVERPLSLDTREQMVASIMSKKLAAGSTHLLIDLPVGPTAKLTNGTEAMRLRKLFEFVGDRFGIAVEVITTDGRQPIGNGIGPVLEAQDVMAVLANDPAAPMDLREKSLRLAAHLLEYDPKLRGGAGYARARELLDSGAALKQMQKIIDAQGPSNCRTDLGNLTFDVTAGSDGVVSGIDCLQIEPAGADRGRAARQGSRHQAVQEDRRPRRKRRAAVSDLRFRSVGARSCGGEREDRYRLRDRKSDIASRPGEAVSNVAIQSLPSGAGDAGRLAALLGLALQEIALHRFPDGEMRVTVGRCRRDDDHLCLARPAERQAHCSPVRRGSAAAGGRQAARAAGALSLLHAPGRSLQRRRSDQPEGGRPAHRGNCGSRDHGGCPPSSHARHQRGFSRHRGRKPVGHAGDRECAALGRDRSRDDRGRPRRGVRGPG